MSTLTLLALIVAGVAVAYLLEEWSERSNVKIFTPQNWFGSSRSGSWTETTLGGVSEIVTYLGLGVIIFSLWLAANVPQMKFTGVFYAIFMLFYAFGWVAEIVHPEWRWIAFLDMGAKEKWPLGILAGAVGGALFFAASTISGFHIMGVGMSAGLFSGVAPLVTFLTLVVAVPVAESGFFNAVLLPTFCEDVGIIPGVALIAVGFGLFHLFAFQASSSAILLAICFMIYASLLTLYQRAIVGAVFAHMTFNLLSFMASIGALEAIL